jgi:predicted enzyme related to lactoylglutathione lyase
MLTTQYVTGAPNWIDLGTPDIEAAASFYGDLFGWSFQSAGPDSGGYGFFQLDGRTVAAVGPLMEEGAASAWTVYFQTLDADATAKAVEQAGGTVRFGPLDVFAAGRLAAFTDPGGARFAVWQPGQTKGLELVSAPGALCWAELLVPDPETVRPFYQAVFDWSVRETRLGDETYSVLSTAEGADPEFGGLRPAQPGDSAHWLAFFAVSDCDAVVAKAAEQGGRTVAPAVTVEGVGRIAVLADPFGARFGVITTGC